MSSPLSSGWSTVRCGAQNRNEELTYVWAEIACVCVRFASCNEATSFIKIIKGDRRAGLVLKMLWGDHYLSVRIEAMDRFGIDKPDLRYDMEPLGEGEMSFAPNRRVGSHAECWKAFPGRWRFSRLIWGIIELLAYPLSITRNHSSSSD